MGNTAVVRTYIFNCKGHLTGSERRKLNELCTSLGMFQQDLVSIILVWWLKQPVKVQTAIARSENPGSHKALSKIAQLALAKKGTYEYRVEETSQMLVADLDELGEEGWELVSVQPTTWIFKRSK